MTAVPPSSSNVMDYLGFAYAGTVALGGVMGFVKAGSVPSLAAGLAMGGLMALGAQRASNNPHDVYLALGVSATLLGLMGSKFLKGGKFMPAGLVAGMSLVMTARYAYRLLA